MIKNGVLFQPVLKHTELTTGNSCLTLLYFGGAWVITYLITAVFNFCSVIPHVRRGSIQPDREPLAQKVIRSFGGQLNSSPSCQTDKWTDTPQIYTA